MSLGYACRPHHGTNKLWLLPRAEASADFILFWNKQHFQEAMDGKRSVNDALDTVKRDANQHCADWKSRNQK